LRRLLGLLGSPMMHRDVRLAYGLRSLIKIVDGSGRLHHSLVAIAIAGPTRVGSLRLQRYAGFG
jgi:hypothetical protein